MPSDETTVQEDPRAERAILLASEAYRLVQEAKDMREERDAATARADALLARLEAAENLCEVVEVFWQYVGDIEWRGVHQGPLRLIDLGDALAAWERAAGEPDVS